MKKVIKIGLLTFVIFVGAIFALSIFVGSDDEQSVYESLDEKTAEKYVVDESLDEKTAEKYVVDESYEEEAVEGFVEEVKGNKLSDQSNPFWVDTSRMLDNYMTEGTYSDGANWDYKGGCHKLGARTVVITVLASCKEGKWDMNSKSDQKLLNQNLYNMYTATEWLKEQATAYGYNDSYYYCNWKEFPNLVYQTYVEGNYSAAKQNLEQRRNYIMQFEIERIKADYNAENVAFVFLYKTRKENTEPSSAHYAFKAVDTPYKFEYIDMPIYYCNQYEPPAVYAHEMLHLFGAQDLYCANMLISQEYVDYHEKNNTNDIMRTQRDIKTGKFYYKGITNELSEIDAYYTYLTDYSADVEQWNLGQRAE